MIKKVFLIAVILLNYLSAKDITIAVASNVSYAMNTLKKEFSRLYPHIKVKVILSGSGKLTAQIKNGAPYELFMSANMMYPQALYDDGLATTAPRVYAQGALAYLSVREQNFSQGLQLLQSPSIDKIAIANPKTAPYGTATIEAIKNAGIYESIAKKFVYAESISQTVSYTITATDIGFIAKSSLYSPQMSHFKKNINYVDVDPTLYTPINQGIVILKNADSSKEVQAFYNFMFSKQAKDILIKFGYLVP